MKKLIIVLISLNLMACGMAEDLTRACKGDLDTLCDMLFGRDSEDLDQIQDQVEDNTDRIDNLDERIVLLESSISLISYKIDSIGLRIINLENSVGNIETTYNPSSLISTMNSLQTQVNNLTISLANMQSENPVVDYVDPCGDGNGYDEILMKTRDGSYVAYFQSGNGNNQRRHLTVLSPGSYRTTDQQQCNFTIDSSGNLID